MNAFGYRGPEPNVVDDYSNPAAFELRENVVAPGGTDSAVRAHGQPVGPNLDRRWSRNIAIHDSLVDTVTTPPSVKTVRSANLDQTRLLTHRFKFGRNPEIYDTFGRAYAQVPATTIST